MKTFVVEKLRQIQKYLVAVINQEKNLHRIGRKHSRRIQHILSSRQEPVFTLQS